MTNKEIENIREEIEKLKTKQNELKKLQKKIASLEETKEVKEYLSLINIYEDRTTGLDLIFDDLTTKELVHLALGKYNVTPSDDIYVYIGTYKKIKDRMYGNECQDVLVSRFNKDADYIIYKNIEVMDNSSVKISYQEADAFEKTRRVIYPENVSSKEKYYCELQNKYFETVILNSKKTANKNINKLVNKNHNL